MNIGYFWLKQYLNFLRWNPLGNWVLLMIQTFRFDIHFLGLPSEIFFGVITDD